MFSLTEQRCTIAHLNTRVERHGEEKVQAADVKIVFNASNDILDLFHDGLRKALYAAPPAENPEQLFETPDHLPIAKFEDLPMVPWAQEIIGRKVTIDYGRGGNANIVLANATIDRFKFGILQGGSVEVTMRVKDRPDAATISKLYTLLGRETKVTVQMCDQQTTIEGEVRVVDDGAPKPIEAQAPIAPDGPDTGAPESGESAAAIPEASPSSDAPATAGPVFGDADQAQEANRAEQVFGAPTRRSRRRGG